MRLFEDGFDHYGDSESNMLDGTYAQVSGGAALATSPTPPTGTHCIGISDGNASIGFLGLRKVLPTSVTKIGVAARFYIPSFTAEHGIFCFQTGDSSTSQIRCVVDANGRLLFRRGSAADFNLTVGTLVAQTDPVLTTAAWSHVEIQLYIHSTAGWIRVAVNGVHVYEVTDINTQHTTGGIVSVGQNHIFGVQDNPFYMDDYYIYDFTGDPSKDTDFCPTTDGSGLATNYIGDLQVMYLKPTADTAQDDWVPSTGSDSYAMVDEVDPNDADYISSTAVDDLTEMEFEDLPEDITYVRGVSIVGRLSKSDAGAAHISYGTKSFSTSIDATSRPVTVEPTYWRDMANIDPNTGAATGLLTFTDQPEDTETVVIGGKTYTFQAVLTNTDGNVLRGATLADSITNLKNAINLGTGAGTTYAASTTIHPDVSATDSATILTVTAKVAGEDGNAITTTATVADASWGDATLTGGDAGSRWTRANLNGAWVRLTRVI